ncbi:hypothetical protein EDB80DRAFT_893373 [Ilyonectria destructans]|nr:hypothetical protein EDB80DRAFT_893373 [Ilyonectria destructans]
MEPQAVVQPDNFARIRLGSGTLDARGIAELLRDADGKSYSAARAAGEDPSISIRLGHDGVYVECNHDGNGATEASSLRAEYRFCYFYPHSTGEPDEGNRRRYSIVAQLQAIHGTVLLFLNNLRSINITILDQRKQRVWSREAQLSRDILGSLAVLRTEESKITPPPKTTITSRFHVFSYTPSDVSSHGQQVGSDLRGLVDSSSTRVTLAFPIDENGDPVMEKQNMHVVTPIRKGPFNFLMDAKFRLSADRDIFSYSRGDWMLRRAIVDVIIKAIQQLCRNTALRYKWMRYLPNQATLRSDLFWSQHTTSIADALSRLPLLWTDIGSNLGQLYSISQLRRLGENEVDVDGRPLFPDLTEEPIYLSVRYERKDVDVLTEYGLGAVQTKDLIPRLRALTEREAWNVKFYQNRDEDWQSRVARRVLGAWEDQREDWKDALKTMPLLPLASGLLRAPADLSSKVYFPDIDGIPIPPDVSLVMILPAAAANPDCRKLYQALGVVSADSATVRSLLSPKGTSARQTSGPPSAPEAVVPDTHLEYLYLMHPGGDMFDQDTDDLTPEWLSIAKDQPERLLSRLYNDFCHPAGRKGWQASQEKTSVIQQTEITCSSGVNRLVFETYLPLPSLLRRCANWLLGDPDKTLPFLKLEKPLTERACKEEAWTKLAINFDIGTDDDLAFTLAVLEAVMAEDVRPKETLTQTVVGIYVRLLEQCNEFAGVKEENEGFRRVRSWFSENPGVLCTLKVGGPDDDASSFTPEWTFPSACRWSAVPDSTSSAEWTLKDVWEPVLESLQPEDRQKLEHFFRDVLRIWNVAYVDIKTTLDSLTSLAEHRFSSNPSEAETGAYHLYMELKHLAQGADEPALNVIRNAFKDNPLIHVHSGAAAGKRWFRTSECVWVSGAAAALDMPCLEPVYRDLSSLFVDVLQISGLGFSQVLQQLATIQRNKAVLSVSQAKVLLESIKDLMPTLPGESNATEHRKFQSSVEALRKELRDTPVFPVRMRDGPVRLLTANDDFAISDENTCEEMVRDKVEILDFDVDAVRRLDPLLQAAGLAEKYMSQSIYVTGQASIYRIFELDQTLSSTICRRAAVWTSIAAHYNSPRVAGGTSELRDILINLRVFNVIKSMPTSAVAGSEGQTDSPLRIEEAVSGKLRIYIPAASEYFDDREYCLASRLPLELAAYLMKCKPSIVDPQIVCTVGSVLQVQPKTALRILREKAIPFLGPAFDEAALRADQLDPHRIMASKKKIKVRVRLPPAVTTPKQPKDKASDPLNPNDSQSKDVLPPQDSPPSLDDLLGMPYPPQVVSARQNRHLPTDSAYAHLLEHVVAKARVAQLPYESAAFDMSTLLDVIDNKSTTETSFSFVTDDQTDWQRMVGAAGELFTFELLLGLKPKLPDFSRDNWESVVRHFAAAHPEYEKLTKNYGPEQSDIFYRDSMSMLTAAFIERGYLDETWRGSTPGYYIEVKTTMRNLEKSFFMSSYQFDQMKAIRESQAYQQKKQLYVIFRVYGLNSGHVGVKVYADPLRAKEEERLDFELTNGSWTVTPQTSRTHPAPQTLGHSRWTPVGGIATTFDFGRSSIVFGESPGSL